MLFQTWLDLLLVKQRSNRQGRRPGTKPRDKPNGLSLFSIPTRDIHTANVVELRLRAPAGSNRSAHPVSWRYFLPIRQLTVMVELRGIEPRTFWMQTRRSPS